MFKCCGFTKLIVLSKRWCEMFVLKLSGIQKLFFHFFTVPILILSQHFPHSTIFTKKVNKLFLSFAKTIKICNLNCILVFLLIINRIKYWFNAKLNFHNSLTLGLNQIFFHIIRGVSRIFFIRGRFNFLGILSLLPT